MAICEIIRLGNPELLNPSTEVTIGDDAFIAKLKTDLRDTARAFNQSHGWGRAISAIQIGVDKRIIYVDAPDQMLIINPQVINPSEEMIEIWDDCMSFPELLVKVKRHKYFTLRYYDENWQQQEKLIDGELSELLQHELDHLDGIVATMRAVDPSQIALQTEKKFLNSELFANPTGS